MTIIVSIYEGIIHQWEKTKKPRRELRGRHQRYSQIQNPHQPKKRCRERTDPSAQQEEIKTGSKLVLIKWIDSFGCSSTWQPLGQIEDIKPMTCCSVGWIDYENDDCVVVIPHVSEDHNGIPQQGCGDMTIPRQAILNITPLTLPRFRRLYT